MNAPDLPGPQPPRFSKRVWHGDVFRDTLATAFSGPGPDQGLVIYVEAIRSTFPEDWHTEADAWRAKRAFMSKCFSIVEPDGEIGFTPLAEVAEISEEEFRGAIAGLRARNWPGRRDD